MDLSLSIMAYQIKTRPNGIVAQHRKQNKLEENKIYSSSVYEFIKIELI